MALISKGIQLFYAYGELSGPGFKTEAPDMGTNAYELVGLQEIGELSGLGTATSRDKIEITTLADDRHVFTDGLIADAGDMAGISFKLLFDATDFDAIQNHAEWEQTKIGNGEKAKLGSWIVRLSDGTKFTMKATVTDIKLDGAGVNAALTMSLTLTPYEVISFAVGA